MFEKYGSEDKNRITVPGGHNGARPAFLRDSARCVRRLAVSFPPLTRPSSIFFAQCLQLDLDAANAGYNGAGPAGATFGHAVAVPSREDDELAAAIAASLADMN